MKRSAIILTVLLFVVLCTEAQKKVSLEQVAKVYLRNKGTIKENNQVRGYYFLYQTDNLDKLNSAYSLQILDANLNRIKTFEFQETQETLLIGSVYNGVDFMFLFYDYKRMELTYRIYGADGVQKHKYYKTLSNLADANLKDRLHFNTRLSDLAIDINQKGFLSITPTWKDRGGESFDISYYASDGKVKWTYLPEKNNGAFAKFLGMDGSTCFFYVQYVDKKESDRGYVGKSEIRLVGIDLETGAKKFDIPTIHDGFAILPTVLRPGTEPGSVIVSGAYYSGNSSIWADFPLGIAFWTLNEKGEFIQTKYSSLNGDINRIKPVDNKGKLQDIGYLVVHDMIPNANGNSFVVAEGYELKKGKINVNDLVLFEFNKNFEVEKIHQGSKSHSFKGLYYRNTQLQAAEMKELGDFDYSFTQIDGNNEGFFVAYYENGKQKTTQDVHFGTMSYSEGHLVNDHLNLHSDADRVELMPAQPGFVMLIEYYKTTMKINLRLEKLN